MGSLSNIGIIVLLACIVVSRIISERALKKLTSEEKVVIIDSFAKLRTYNLIPLVVLFIAFFSANYLVPSIGHSLYIVFLVLILAFLIGLNFLIFKKLKALKVPSNYTKTVIFSKSIVIAGFVFWIGVTIYPVIDVLG
jgi:hypothetical protein